MRKMSLKQTKSELIVTERIFADLIHGYFRQNNTVGKNINPRIGLY